MTTSRWVLLWTGSAALGLAGMGLIPLSKDRVVTIPVTSGVAAETPARAFSAQTSEEVIRAAPFRADRSMPLARYGSGEEAGLVTTAERPEWVLTGILSGDPPLAVFEELPGEGDATYVITAGDSVGEYHIGVVESDSVVVSLGDVSWTFTLGTPWS